MRNKLHVSHRTLAPGPICEDNYTSAGDHEPASARSCRPRQKTTSYDNGHARSHPTISPTSSPRFNSGKQMHGAFQNHERDIWTSSQCHQSRRGSTAWNTVDDQTVETPPTPHGVRAMRGILRHSVSGISDVDPHGTIGGHPACIATTGATRDEGQEEQSCEFSGGSVGARQSFTERQPGNSVEEGTERLRSSNDCDPEGRQCCDVLRTM